MKNDTTLGEAPKDYSPTIHGYTQPVKRRKLLNASVESSTNGSAVNKIVKHAISLTLAPAESPTDPSGNLLKEIDSEESMRKQESFQVISTKGNIKAPPHKPDYQIPMQEVTRLPGMPPSDKPEKPLRQARGISWGGYSSDSMQPPLTNVDVLTSARSDESRQHFLSREQSCGSLGGRSDVGNMSLLIQAASATSDDTKRSFSHQSFAMSFPMDGCSSDDMAHLGRSGMPVDSMLHLFKQKSVTSQDIETRRAVLPRFLSNQPSSDVLFMDDTKPEVQNTIVKLYQKRAEEVPCSAKEENSMRENLTDGPGNDKEGQFKNQLSDKFRYSNERFPPMVGNQPNSNAARLQESKSLIQESILKLYEERSGKSRSSTENVENSTANLDFSNGNNTLSSVITGVMEIFEQHKKKAEVEALQRRKCKPRKIRGALANLPKRNKLFVDKPLETDVLFGRGTGPRQHPGNKEYYRRVGSMRDAYRAKSTSSEGKTRIANEILSWIKERGRFLAKEEDGTDRWVEVDEAKAREKIRQALREHKYEWERNAAERNNKTND